ncbi:hypothetical protein B0H17DRAFT_1130091 [Mycena rosella]|uniref:Uncharacterized protein n=1 Tax=Mycena rosella TaxID=1033263 RepID=A0AAD7GMF4_MYCRO|nr:hypothetical protein B0H17DRAFT_1130091 [Mycena rosella]
MTPLLSPDVDRTGLLLEVVCEARLSLLGEGTTVVVGKMGMAVEKTAWLWELGVDRMKGLEVVRETELLAMSEGVMVDVEKKVRAFKKELAVLDETGVSLLAAVETRPSSAVGAPTSLWSLGVEIMEVVREAELLALGESEMGDVDNTGTPVAVELAMPVERGVEGIVRPLEVVCETALFALDEGAAVVVVNRGISVETELPMLVETSVAWTAGLLSLGEDVTVVGGNMGMVVDKELAMLVEGRTDRMEGLLDAGLLLLGENTTLVVDDTGTAVEKELAMLVETGVERVRALFVVVLDTGITLGICEVVFRVWKTCPLILNNVATPCAWRSLKVIEDNWRIWHPIKVGLIYAVV